MNIKEKIVKCEDKFNFMSHWYEIYFEYQVLKYHSPQKIIEIGAGAGGWALTIHELLENDTLQFYLIEDFSGPGGMTDYYFPKNISELVNHIKNKNPKINFTLDKKYKKTKKYDVLRYDAWGYTSQELEFIINNLRERSLIIFDDFTFNTDPDQMFYVLSLAQKKLIFPIYSSNKISCWSNSKEYSLELINYLKEIKDIIINDTGARFLHFQIHNVEEVNLNLILLKVKK